MAESNYPTIIKEYDDNYLTNNQSKTHDLIAGLIHIKIRPDTVNALMLLQQPGKIAILDE